MKNQERSVEEQPEHWANKILLLSNKSDKTRSGLETIYDPYALIDEIRDILQAERQRCDEMVEDILKMADTLEIECGKDGDKGTKQWIAFKGFRNTIRDKYLTQPNNK